MSAAAPRNFVSAAAPSNFVSAAAPRSFVSTAARRFHKGIPFMTWPVKTGVLVIAQIHGYLLGLKSIKTLIVGLQKFYIYLQ